MSVLLKTLAAIPGAQWVSIAFGLLSLSREIFKWMAEHEKSTRAKAVRVHQFKRAVKKAKHENDTSDIMRHFAELAVMRDAPPKPLDAENLSNHG